MGEHAYPVVDVQTEDGIWLHGLHLPATEKESVFLHIHGTADSFYEEDFLEAFARKLLPAGVSFLSTNNRGVGVYDAWAKRGAATEIFEDCLLDIDAWIEFALAQGYSKIFLSGHSLGTEKVVYYLGKGRHADKVRAVVLLAPADSPRWRYFDTRRAVLGSGETGEARVKVQLAVAEKMIEEGRGDELMDRTVYGGVMPKSAMSFVNFMGEGTEILKALPFHSGKLEMYSKITVPIFVAIGDQEEYTAIPIADALQLMKKENPRTEAHQIPDCDHDFAGKEEELTEYVLEFIKRLS